MSNWVGKNRRPLTISAERCTQCNLWAQNCPTQLSLAAIKEQSSLPHGGDCLKCRVCVESCPRECIVIGSDINVLGYQHARFAKAECTACGLCYYVCPEPGAITVVKA